MLINNKENATKIKLGYSLFIIIFLLLLVLSLIFTFLPNYLFEIIWSSVCVIIFAVYLKINYNYIYYTSDGNSIIFRYQPLNPFITNPKSIEIPKNSFVKFETKSSFFNLKEEIVFYQKTKQGIAKYPPISISSLSKTERGKLKKSLS